MIPKVVATAIIGLTAIVVRLAVRQAVRRGTWSNGDEGRRLLVLARNGTLIFGLAAIAMVWAAELRVVGISLVAVAVALVIATQDVIRSVVASLVRATASQYTIGDRISIGDVRGYVIDHSLVQTTLLEIGATHMRTGRTVSVPNSLLMTMPVYNESSGHQYMLHSFLVTVPEQRWREAMTVLTDAAVEYSRPFVDDVRAAMDERARRHSLPLPATEPLVFGRPEDGSRVSMTVRVPVDTAQAGLVERQITHRWLDHLHPEPRADDRGR